MNTTTLNISILQGLALAAAKLSKYLSSNDTTPDHMAKVLANVVALNILSSGSTEQMNTSQVAMCANLYQEISSKYNIHINHSTKPDELVNFIYGVKGLSVYHSLIGIGLDVVSLDFWQILVDSLTFKPRKNHSLEL